jgi:nucleoid-associated protein YgaU
LRTIAEQQYGDQALWQKLYQANTDVIGNNPDALQPGMRLRIPPE